MKAIRKKKMIKKQIDRLDKVIRKTPVDRSGRLMQLYEKREALERAFCGVEK